MFYPIFSLVFYPALKMAFCKCQKSMSTLNLDITIINTTERII